MEVIMVLYNSQPRTRCFAGIRRRWKAFLKDRGGNVYCHGYQCLQESLAEIFDKVGGILEADGNAHRSRFDAGGAQFRERHLVV